MAIAGYLIERYDAERLLTPPLGSQQRPKCDFAGLRPGAAGLGADSRAGALQVTRRAAYQEAASHSLTLSGATISVGNMRMFTPIRG